MCDKYFAQRLAATHHSGGCNDGTATATIRYCKQKDDDIVSIYIYKIQEIVHKRNKVLCYADWEFDNITLALVLLMFKHIFQNPDKVLHVMHFFFIKDQEPAPTTLFLIQMEQVVNRRA